mgnify:CR=1 FL=1
MIKHTTGHFIVKQAEEENVTESGIIVNSKDRKNFCNKGEVISGNNSEIKEGDTVYFDRGASWHLEEGIYSVKESAVMGIVK